MRNKNLVEESIQKIGKSTGIVLSGTVFTLFLGLISRIFIVRFITPNQYGIYSLGLAITTLLVSLSILGLNHGIPRQISYHRGENKSKVKNLIGSSIGFSILMSILSFLFLFLSSNVLATKIFGDPALTTALRVFSFAIPFSILINIFVSIFRGFGKDKPKIYFQNIMRGSIFLLLIGLVIGLGLSFIGVIYAYVLSFVVSALVFAVYAIKTQIPINFKVNFINSTSKELILFSIPLLGTSILFQVMDWTDTILLGVFKSSEIVGLYQGAYPLAKTIPLALGGAGFLFLPILTGLYSDGKRDNSRRIYQISTKWIFYLSLSLFFLLFLFPEMILNFLFGPEYTEASMVLRILSLGFLGRAFFGPNGLSLIAIGESNSVFYGDVGGTITNISLNIALIPYLGIIGAAIASTVSLIARNGYFTKILLQKFRIHPFSEKYLKQIAISFSILLFFFILQLLVNVQLWMLPIFLIAYLLVTLIVNLIFRTFDKEETELLLKIGKKLGIKTGLIKKIIKKLQKT
ncbi:hypothetical protein AKJ65_06630 [candidate division MSBL1 archaeon SCGC-AAA259E19]|uniref:Uncharacterized protein n=1 Tax=candidate division MSBL1 archaeon SCGC-AAA259E19 TaxID=1698264 RepID=A0A133UG03_9EURY|nr:hypothetical protein AKJ65_06630 [candidate division MSBL1 archaeon SCGC-AAA259E19]